MLGRAHRAVGRRPRPLGRAPLVPCPWRRPVRWSGPGDLVPWGRARPRRPFV